MPFVIRDAALDEVRRAHLGTLEKCGALVERNMKKLTKVSGRHAIPKSKMTKNLNGKRRKNAAKETYEPSQPGEPPHQHKGHLNISIEHAIDYVTQTVVIGACVSYAKHLEYGTRNMAARPFVKPALLMSIPHFPGGVK